MRSRKPVQFGLGSLFVLLAMIAVLLAIPAAQERREHERRAEATRKLKQFGEQFQQPATRSTD